MSTESRPSRLCLLPLDGGNAPRRIRDISDDRSQEGRLERALHFPVRRHPFSVHRDLLLRHGVPQEWCPCTCRRKQRR